VTRLLHKGITSAAGLLVLALVLGAVSQPAQAQFMGYGAPGGYGYGYPGYGYGAYGVGYGYSMYGPIYGAYGPAGLGPNGYTLYGYGVGWYRNPYFGVGLSPLGVQSALSERYLLGRPAPVVRYRAALPPGAYRVR
jgi:hypothetical protein